MDPTDETDEIDEIVIGKLSGKEIHSIGWETVRMHARISDQNLGQFSETISGDGIRNDKDPVVKAFVVIELERETDKIIAIPGHKAALLQGSSLQLLEIREPFCHDLVCADGIESAAAEHLCNLLAQILIQIVSQERSWTRDGCRSASCSLLQASLRASWRSISTG